MAREFMDDPSELYKETVTQLRQLVTAEGLGIAERAFAEAVCEKRLEEALDEDTINSSKPEHVFKLMRGLSNKVPGSDHTSVLVKNGEPIAFVSQPYNLSWGELTELVKFCKREDFEAEINAQLSWYFPSASLFVRLTKADPSQTENQASYFEEKEEPPDIQQSPIYGSVVTFHGEELSVSEAAEKYEVDNIIQRFGQWAVTDYGLECLATHYPIPKQRLNEADWIEHMSRKSWVNIQEFELALRAAKKYHRK